MLCPNTGEQTSRSARNLRRMAGGPVVGLDALSREWRRCGAIQIGEDVRVQTASGVVLVGVELPHHEACVMRIGPNLLGSQVLRTGRPCGARSPLVAILATDDRNSSSDRRLVPLETG